MRSTIKLFLVLSLFCGIAMAGDQGNGGYAPCTIDCTEACTEPCDDGSGLSAVDPNNPTLMGTNEVDGLTGDILTLLATEYSRMLF